MKYLKASSVVCFVLSVIAAVNSRPDGAPAAACARIQPLHGTSKSQSLDRVLFTLNISQLSSGGGYHPGRTYNLTLSGTKQFRGILIQGRSNGTNPVGSFKVINSLTKLSACTPKESAVTHTSNALKNNVRVAWTAPLKGTGDVVFNYAVVVDYKTFYATMKTSVIKEIADTPFNVTPSASFSSPSANTLPKSTASFQKTSLYLVPSPSSVPAPPTEAQVDATSTVQDMPTALIDSLTSSASALGKTGSLTAFYCSLLGIVSVAMAVF